MLVRLAQTDRKLVVLSTQSELGCERTACGLTIARVLGQTWLGVCATRQSKLPGGAIPWSGALCLAGLVPHDAGDRRLGLSQPHVV